MQVTFPGFFLLPIGFLLCFLSPKFLYYLTIFFIPFSATSLVNSQSGAPLMATQYLGGLLIYRTILDVVFEKKISVAARFKEDKSIFFMALFIVVVIVTMIMPIIIDGHVMVSNMRLNDLEEVPLRLTSQNWKNPLPVIFGMLLAYIVATKNSTLKTLLTTLRVYVLSLSFVSLWGLLELLCFSIGVQFPYFIFNSSVHDSAQALGTTIAGGSLLRITSVTLEPSLLSQNLLLGVSILVSALMNNTSIFTKYADKVLLFVIVSTLLVSTSTTSYFGLLLLFVIFLTISRLTGCFKVKRVMFGGVLLSVLGFIAFNLNPSINAYISEILFEKQDTGSTLERLLSITTAWEYFKQYPVLGLGWATVTSHDLFVCLLANSGVVGLVSFLALIFCVNGNSISLIRAHSAQPCSQDRIYVALAFGLTVSFIAHICVSIFTEFTYYLSHFYLFLGMLIGANIGLRRRLNAVLSSDYVKPEMRIIYE